MIQLKSVLHFYIGQYAMHGDKRVHICGLNVNSDKIQNILNEEYILISEIKPILRPLSSMTEEEIKELFQYEKISKVYQDISINRKMGGDKLVGLEIDYTVMTDDGEMPQSWMLWFHSLNAHDFIWLLSKGFDLFNLIPSHQALEKTT